MTAQEATYTEIERLVKSFKAMPAAQRKRLGYILPLFKALGWDTSNINKVGPEVDPTEQRINEVYRRIEEIRQASGQGAEVALHERTRVLGLNPTARNEELI